MDMSTKLRDQIASLSEKKVSRAQQIVVEAIISAWQTCRKDALTSPFPEPNIMHFDLDDTAPGSPDNYVDISWLTQASFHIQGSLSMPNEVVCIIYTIDSRKKLSPPMHFRLKEDDMQHARADWESLGEKPRDFQSTSRALAIAIEHVLRHIDLFKYQDNFDIFND